MSFIVTLDQLFDEKNLLDLLYGYYLQYVGINDQYWNLETLEVIDFVRKPRKSIDQQICGGRVENNTFMIINTQTKEVLFTVELDNPVLVDYVEDKYLLKCNNKILIYDKDFKCVEISSNFANKKFVFSNKNNIFMYNNKQLGWPTFDIYDWQSTKIISIKCIFHHSNDTKLITYNPGRIDIYDINSLLLLETFNVHHPSILCTSDKYIIGNVDDGDKLYILDLEFLSLKFLSCVDIPGKNMRVVLNPYIQDDTLVLCFEPGKLIFYSLLLNKITKTISIVDKLGEIQYFTSKYLIFISNAYNINVLNLETNEITLLGTVERLKIIRTPSGILFTC